jgi:phosphatidylinositol alpha-1,6-mannosyltransferase
MKRAAAIDRRKMATLLAVPWDGDCGGVISVVANLARYFQARGQEVYFFHPGRTLFLKRRMTKLGFPGIQLRLNMPFGPKPRRILRTVAFPFLLTLSVLQLIWFMRRRHIRFVNIHYPGDEFVYFAICRLFAPVRLITSLHGNDVFDLQGQPKDRYSNAFRLILRLSDLIILPSAAYRFRLWRAFPGVREKTMLVYNGVNPDQFQPAEHTNSGRGENQYLLCVAEHREYKGIDVLLHALKRLIPWNPSVKLALAGDGPLRRDLEDLAASLGVRNNVRFLGHQGAAEVVALLQGCLVFVLPSRADNCPVALIEAMACRKPVVACAVGGIPELIQHENSGILVEPENPEALAKGLRRVLENDELRSGLAERGYRRAMQHFCFAYTGAAYEKAFADLFHLPVFRRPVFGDGLIQSAPAGFPATQSHEADRST